MINPETFTEDTEEEREERQRRTGQIGSGLYVICTPRPYEEPEVTEVQHRVVCLTRPYPACQSCRHSRFTLLFNGKPDARFDRVLCPRWSSVSERLKGKNPDQYVTTEIATCAEKPFEFCPSCPARETLAKMDIDKTREGWVSRWKRFTEDDGDDE